jgi:hypothetical protein
MTADEVRGVLGAGFTIPGTTESMEVTASYTRLPDGTAFLATSFGESVDAHHAGRHLSNYYLVGPQEKKYTLKCVRSILESTKGEGWEESTQQNWSAPSSIPPPPPKSPQLRVGDSRDGVVRTPSCSPTNTSGGARERWPSWDKVQPDRALPSWADISNHHREIR